MDNKIASTQAPQQPGNLAVEPQSMLVRFIMGAIGGLLAAIVGGLVWGLVMFFLDYELGILAWGIGVFAGYAVGRLSQNGRGFLFQIIAIASGLFGIFFGKYFGFFLTAYRYYSDEMGVITSQDLPNLSIDVLIIMISNWSELFNAYDILFIGLAVYYAWKMLRKPKLAASSLAGGSVQPSDPQ